MLTNKVPKPLKSWVGSCADEIMSCAEENDIAFRHFINIAQYRIPPSINPMEIQSSFV
jgi:hypothetical protein